MDSKNIVLPPEVQDSCRSAAMPFFSIGYYGCAMDGTVLFMDATAFGLFDLYKTLENPDAAVGKVLDKLTGESVHADLRAQLKQNQIVRGYEWPLKLDSGEERWLYEDARLARPTGQVAQHISEPFAECVIRNITVRKHKEAVYLADQHKYQTILETIHEGYYEMDLRGHLTFFNRPLANILGVSEEKLIGQNPAAVFHNDAITKEMRRIYLALRNGEISDGLLDWQLKRDDGTTAVLEVSVSLMYDKEGKPGGFRGLVRDVTERVSAEEAYRIAEMRYKNLFEEANDIVYTHDFQGKFTSLNKEGERLSGYTREEASKLSVYEIIAPEHREKALEMTRRRLQGEQVGKYEIEILSKDGSRIPVEVSAGLVVYDGRPIGVQGIARDITERRRAEEQRKVLEQQVQHAQKLEGLGVLAGGIAHDFNNLLVGILGNASLATRRLEKDSPVNIYLKRVEQAAQRAAELTNQMLAYSGRGTFVVRPLYLDKIIRETVDLAGVGISKKIVFTYEFEDDLPPVMGDVSQMHQVMMNVITNAAEAIGDEVGTITIGVRRTTLDNDDLTKVYFHADPIPGDYVCLSVSDTGCGMDAEQKSKIFDPFFSTKFAGRGLGLAALLGIVRGHKGAVNVYSEPNQGTVFKLFFPVMKKEALAKQLPEEDKGQKEKVLDEWQTTGLALIADDEEAVRAFTREVLQRHGMTVITADDGKEAIALYEKHKDKIRIALVDLMMPFVNGQEVLEHVRSDNPDLPIIISSGYSETEILDRFRKNPPTDFLQKPYRAVALSALLKKTLTDASSVKA